MRPLFANAFNAIEENRQRSVYYNNLTLSLDSGNETQLHKVGEYLLHNRNLKPNFYIEAEVVDVYSENGFWYYVVKNKGCYTFSHTLHEMYNKTQLVTIRNKDILE